MRRQFAVILMLLAVGASTTGALQFLHLAGEAAQRHRRHLARGEDRATPGHHEPGPAHAEQEQGAPSDSGYPHDRGHCAVCWLVATGSTGILLDAAPALTGAAPPRFAQPIHATRPTVHVLGPAHRPRAPPFQLTCADPSA